LAVALGREAIRQNYSVQFVTAATLVAMLAKAHDDGALDKQLDTSAYRLVAALQAWRRV
jgi:DNA replication protein DnaC